MLEIEPFIEGQIVEVTYPFYMVEDHENDPYCPFVLGKWSPGVFHEHGPGGEDYFYANAEGKMKLHIISTHRPGKFPLRVFFTRSFIDPDGKEFGKGRLNIKSIGTFRNFTRGWYGDDYDIRKEPRGCAKIPF